MNSVSSMHEFDYIIGGVHFLGSWGFDFSIEDWRNISLVQCHSHYRSYFSSLKEMVYSNFMHIVAHFDLIKIFIPTIFKNWIFRDEGQKIVLETLMAIRDSGMSLEVSSAGLHKFCKEIYPGLEIMKMAKQLEVYQFVLVLMHIVKIQLVLRLLNFIITLKVLDIVLIKFLK